MATDDQGPTERDARADGDVSVASATKVEGSGRPAPRAEPKLSRGTLVGRYVVLDVLGEGGMGVVYAAYDPELDRKVAIKLLQGKQAGGSSSTGDQAWLAREAQALARLSHPNVIAVHDVGTLSGDRVFVAVELVEGTTLRAWLKQPRDWRAVREVMLAAGAGLAAAHRAGLIHRDFKPENVLVGNDGRVRVMDFGLARLSHDPSDDPHAQRTSDLSIEARSPLSESLTIAGSVVGTPAYMAPEIFDGVAASARSDQFAFGVTLYELLFLARPYDKRAFAPDAGSPRPTQPRVPGASNVPRRLLDIALRAVAVDPAARFGSLDDLLAELAVDPMAKRRRMIAGGAAALALAGVIGATITLTSSPAAPALDPTKLCKDADRRLKGVWDADQKRAIKAAFDATDRPFKTKAFAAIETTLDRYAKEWTATVTESCEATRLRGEQTEDVLSLRQDCLDQKLAILASFTAQLAKADDQLVDKASTAANALESSERIAQCNNVAALRTPTQPTAEIKPQVDKAHGKLAEARAAILTGNIGRAVNQAGEAVKIARAIPFDPTIAEAEMLRGMSFMQVGAGADALTALGDATWAGIRGKRDDVAAESALYAAATSADMLNKPGEARVWLAIGKASMQRAGTDPVLRLRALETEGIVLANAGDTVPAAAAHEQALVLGRQIFGAESTQLARQEQLLGATISRLGDWQRAKPHYERALALTIQLLGPEHPDVAVMYSGLASTLHYTGDIAGSRRAFEAALAIREKVYGTSSPVLIPTLNNFAELLREIDLPAGLAMIARAKQLTDRFVGKDHAYYVSITATYGELLLAAGRIPEARARIVEALAAAEAQKSMYLAATLTTRAALARADKKWAESAAFDERAIKAYEITNGKDAVDLYKPLTGLAIAKLELGKPADARRLLDRAVAIADRAHVPDTARVELRAALARLP